MTIWWVVLLIRRQRHVTTTISIKSLTLEGTHSNYVSSGLFRRLPSGHNLVILLRLLFLSPWHKKLYNRNKNRKIKGCWPKCNQSRHQKSWFSSASQFWRLKMSKTHKVPKAYLKCLKSNFFPLYQIFSNKNVLIVDNYTDLWDWMGKNCKKIVVYPKMSAIFSKVVRKQCLHACDFFMSESTLSW